MEQKSHVYPDSYQSDRKPGASYDPEPFPSHDQEVAVASSPPSHGFQDIWFAVLFLLHVIAIIVVAAVFYFNGDFKKQTTSDGETKTVNYEGSAKTAIGLCAASFSTAIILSIGFLFFARKYANVLITATLWGGAIIMCLFGIGLLAAGIIAGIVGVIVGLFGFLYAYLVRHRIAFASVILRKSVSVVNQYPSMVTVGYVSQFVMMLWLLVWSLAAVGAANSRKNALWILLILSLYWSIEVIRNTCHVTVSGAAATALFQNTSMNQGVVSRSAKRALTTSFGSVCFGSLLIAIVRTLRAIVRNMRAQMARSNNLAVFFLCCVDCALAMLESLARYFNKYAFVHVAIYGKDFISAAKDTWEMFKSHGIDALINDDLIQGVLTLGALLCGAINGAIWAGIAFAVLKHDDGLWVVVLLVAFMVGMSCSLVTSSILDSCVATLFVCYAEQPELLAQSDPEFANQLAAAITAAATRQNSALNHPATITSYQ